MLGITMKIPVSCDTNGRGCCGVDAAFVCNELSIPHYFVDVTQAFEQLIIEPFRESYLKGQTPNPCVDCNTFLKFSLVWEFLQETFDINYLASGHYACITKTDNKIRLGRAKDKSKDQSYFLYGIDAKVLPSLIFPLGKFEKSQVRTMATELNLSIADKPESMELCFAGEDDYRTALTDTQANQPGNMTDMAGEIIGKHKGVANYTIGQRRGIGFAGGKPLYVGKIDAETNTIALGVRDDVSFNLVKASQINTLIPEELVLKSRVYGKIRSYNDPKPCKIINISETEITVEFDELQFAPSPGQKLVIYNSDDNIIAGGTITSALKTE